MKLYKLTDQNGETGHRYKRTKWLPLGTVHETSGEGDLCGPGWLHAYTDPLLAVLLNPIHADIKSPRLFECEGDIGKSDHGLKVGTSRLLCTREIPLPDITTEQRVKFAILASLEVYDDPRYRTWAEAWMSGADRTQKSARVAAWAAAAEAARAAAAEAAAAAAAAAAEAAWAAWAGNIDLIAIARKAIEQ